MAEVLRPETDAQVREAVAWAVAEETPLEIVGSGSKRGFGRPVDAAHVLDLSGLSGITSYEPEELVLSAHAGTPMAEIEAALSEKNQMLAFEPPDFGPLYGGEAGRGTIGGVLACNLSGPRRFAAGAARDHLLGFAAVSGRGEAFKAGGRVVKNVTGYDMSKLMAGSFGTLGVLTEVTVRVVPAPETVRTVVCLGLPVGTYQETFRAAVTAAVEPTGLAAYGGYEIEIPVAQRIRDFGGEVGAFRLEGPAESVEVRAARLKQVLHDEFSDTFDAKFDELDQTESESFWRGVGNAELFTTDKARDWDLWRLSIAPTDSDHASNVLDAFFKYELFVDWGAGRILFGGEPAEDAHADHVRTALGYLKSGGHATLVRAPDDVRRRVPVFHPEPEALAALSRRIKESFDPRGILNPGRMTGAV